MNIPIKTDPDFKADAKRTIDLRPFFDEPIQKKVVCDTEEEEIEKEETFDIDEPISDEYPDNYTPPSSEFIISPAIRSETKREAILEIEREERQRNKPIKRIFLEGLFWLSKTILISLIKWFQDFERYLNPFETKHTEKQLYWLALALPNNVRTADDILIYYGLMSRNQRYKLLRIRRDTYKMYQKIYGKGR